MWSLIKAVLFKWALLKTLLRVLGSLGWLVPLAFILKLVGVPLLILLAVLALPLILVLAVLGLPLLLIAVVGGALLTFTLWIVSFGVIALKIALPIFLVVWLLRWWSNRPPESESPDAA